MTRKKSTDFFIKNSKSKNDEKNNNNNNNNNKNNNNNNNNINLEKNIDRFKTKNNNENNRIKYARYFQKNTKVLCFAFCLIIIFGLTFMYLILDISFHNKHNNELKESNFNSINKKQLNNNNNNNNIKKENKDHKHTLTENFKLISTEKSNNNEVYIYSFTLNYEIGINSSYIFPELTVETNLNFISSSIITYSVCCYNNNINACSDNSDYFNVYIESFYSLVINKNDILMKSINYDESNYQIFKNEVEENDFTKEELYLIFEIKSKFIKQSDCYLECKIIKTIN